MDTSARSCTLRKLLQLFIIGALHEREQILIHEVSVTHRGGEVSVTHRPLHEHGALSFGQAGRDPTVSEAVLPKVARELRALHRRRERTRSSLAASRGRPAGRLRPINGGMMRESSVPRPNPCDRAHPLTEEKLVAWHRRLRDQEDQARKGGDLAWADVLWERAELVWGGVETERHREAMAASARLERDNVGGVNAWWDE